MSIVGDDDWDERYSVIEDKGDAGFLDYEKDKSLYSFDPLEDGPVVISVPFPFLDGKPQSALIGETSADSISIKNTTSDPIELWSVRIFSSNPENTYLLSLMKPPLPGASEKLICAFVGLTALDDRVLQPGQTLNIWLSCKPKEMGLHTAVVHFDVEDEKIERVAFLLAEDKVSLALFSTKPYLRAPSRGKKHNYDQYVAGSCPPRLNTQVFRYKLPQYPVPPDVREMVENKQVPDVVIKGLSASSYGRYFSTLIAMDEIHLEEEMRMHDMEHVTMKRRGYNFLSLEVPGLAEKRPSLVYGDYIFANLASKEPNNASRPYQGYIHKVEADEIFLKFDRNFHQNHRDYFLYNVSFTYNRVNMRRLYQAVCAAENLGPELLFPSDSSRSRIIKACPFQPLDPLINREQQRSVEMILGCRGAPPYVIYGPPGTGKTMTLMEAILQIFTTRKKARILVCASSNSAADHILERLLGALGVDNIRDNEIFRLNAITRPFEDINADYVRFCFFDDTVFRCPPLKALVRYKIIISTYMSASYLYAEGIPKGHFSHIFLDEAGQASEPETMVPISNLCTKQTVIVLAGDPMQLGPVIHSRSAESYGLGKSYLERLFESHHCQSNDENYVTKLVRNYRCHPAILELPSKLFYKSELIACKQEDESSLYEWEDLPNKSFPVLFVGIQGCDEREGSDPSWFNRIEASKVVEIIRKLMTNTGLSDSDIGVITPYRQQVLKLKKALESLEISALKVGSVEQFQGQEREVIIISTVRSTVKYNEFDRIHNLGFLSNPRRFNVSTTRAKSLLIIVGNPHIITKDPYWDKLLRYCADHGSYQGCPLPPPEDHGYSDGAALYGGGQEFLTSDSNAETWGMHMPNNYTDDVECFEYTPNQYSNEVEREDGTSGTEWGDQVLRSYSNDAEWHDPISKEYSNETEWGYHTSKPYCNGAKGGNEEEWYDDNKTHNSGNAEWNNDSMKSSSHRVGWVDDASEAERADDNHVPHSSGAERRNEDPNHYCYGRRIRMNTPKPVNFGWND